MAGECEHGSSPTPCWHVATGSPGGPAPSPTSGSHFSSIATRCATCSGTSRCGCSPRGTYDRNVSLRRYLHHRRLGHRFFEVARTLQPPDAIVCAFPVIDLAYYAARYAKVLRIPLVIDVRDLRPDTFLGKLPTGSQWLGRLLFVKDFRRAHYTCAAASSCLSISQGCLDWALTKAGRPAGPGDRVFHTGYPDAPMNEALPRAPIRPEWSGKVLFTFVGSFGELVQPSQYLRRR